MARTRKFSRKPKNSRKRKSVTRYRRLRRGRGGSLANAKMKLGHMGALFMSSLEDVGSSVKKGAMSAKNAIGRKTQRVESRL